jgi:hypothetical protein
MIRHRRADLRATIESPEGRVLEITRAEAVARLQFGLALHGATTAVVEPHCHKFSATDRKPRLATEIDGVARWIHASRKLGD